MYSQTYRNRNPHSPEKSEGKTGLLLQSVNWTETALGARDTWPGVLKVSLDTILSAPVPMAIGWGRSLVYLYNDAFIRLTGDHKHPACFGKLIPEVYDELWADFSTMYDTVFGGGSISFNEVPTPVFANGEKEDAWYDFSCSPIWLNEQEVGGILFIAKESTQRIQAISNAQKAREDLETTVRLRHQELMESEERFRTMAERADILISTNNENGEVDYLNRAWLDFFGRSEEELVKFGWVDYLHPEDKDQMLKEYTAAFEKHTFFSLEFRIRNRDGEYRWFYSKGAPRFYSDGRFAGIVASSIDVTDRKRHQQELQLVNDELALRVKEIASANIRLKAVNEELSLARQHLLSANQKLAESETKFRSLVENSPIAQQIFRGENMTFEMVNDKMLEFLGKTSDIIGKTLFEGVPEIVGQPIVDLLYQVYRTGESMELKAIEVTLNRNGGDEKGFYDVSYRALYNDGQITGVLGIAIDVTEQIVALKMLEHAEERMRIVMEAANMGSFTICVDDGTFDSSPRLKEFFGFLPDEDMPYAAASAQVHADYRDAVLKMGERAYLTGENFDMEYPIIGYRDGKTRWVRGIGTIQQDSNGKRYYTGVLNEITEQKQDNQRKNDFIGMVSHELKTPLTSLTAIIQLTSRMLQKSNNTFLAGAMEKADHQTRRMSNMINSFLDISRLESGKLLIEKEAFNIDQLIRESVEEIQMSTASHQIHILSGSETRVMADRDKINSVIINLLSNAVKYSPERTQIWVNSETDGGGYRFSVKDEGMGIKPDDLTKLFNRYYRVENAYTKHISGFGIGLYLSAEIIERHQGKLWVESELGKGSTFYFTLPVLETEISG